MGIYKAKPYFQGGWGKYRKINNLGIIGQSKILDKFTFKILSLRGRLIGRTADSGSACGGSSPSPAVFINVFFDIPSNF
jgi:hypothetical protein